MSLVGRLARLPRSSHHQTVTVRSLHSRAVASTTTGPSMEQRIKDILTSTFEPVSLRVDNDSHKHAHHAAMRADPELAKRGETHFSVQVVSEKFNGLRTIARHRLVNEALKPEFDNGLHALAIKAIAPDEV